MAIWHQLHKRDVLATLVGRGGAVCVVATLLATGQPVGFVETRDRLSPSADETLRYVKTRLRGEHSARAYRIARGHAPCRRISYALVAPRRRRDIARLAESTFQRRYGGIRGFRDIDFAVMARTPGAATRSRGEFLSFLLFDHEFTRALIEMGRRDATRWLHRHPQFWCHDASHDLGLGQLERSRIIEHEAIDEFRSHRRH